jgi:hypothetical protein
MSLPTQYQQFIHLSRYSRFRDELGRRETWIETVDRYFDFFDNCENPLIAAFFADKELSRDKVEGLSAKKKVIFFLIINQNLFFSYRF